MSAYTSTATNATASSPVAGGGAIPVDDEALVYHVDLFLVALLAVYAATRLPRAFALFGASKEWLNGHFFRRVSSRPSNRRFAANTGAYPPIMNGKERISPNAGSSDDNHIPYNHAYNSQRVNEKGKPVTMNFPPHVAACPKVLRPLLTPLRSRVAPGFSVAQLLILSIYFFCLVYAGFYRSNVFTDLTRTGWIAIAQLPFVFAFSQKNNLLGSIIGCGYEKLNFLHRFAGRIVVLAANLHSLHWIYKWSLDGTLSTDLKNPSTVWGFVALLCVDLIFLFSTEYWRGKAYNLFLSTHIFGFTLVLPALYLHKDGMLTYILACVALFGMDHVFRLLKTRVATAQLRPLPELEMTRIEVPTLNAGWRAGQHVRLRVLSTAMGWASWLEVHPFTIASVSRSEEGMVLMVKKAGGWTKKMYEVAKMGGYTEGGVGREMKVAIEGPYGGPQHTIFSSFSAAVFVAGGSGITFALSAIQDLVQKDLAGESRVKIIELVWIVPDPASLAPLLPLLSSLIQQSVFTPLRISVFYTRAPTGKQPAYFSSSSAGPFSTSPMPASAFANPAASPAAPPIPKRPPPLNLHESSEATPFRRGDVAPLKVSMKRSGSGGAAPPAHAGVKRSGTGHSARTPAPALEPIASAASGAPSHFPPGLTLAPGRPRLLKFIEHALQRAVTLGQGHRHMRAKDDALALSGLVVAVCGPGGMADDVAEAVAGVDPLRRDQVGGVELVEEVFGW